MQQHKPLKHQIYKITEKTTTKADGALLHVDFPKLAGMDRKHCHNLKEDPLDYFLT